MAKIGSFFIVYFYCFLALAQDISVSLDIDEKEVGLGDIINIVVSVQANKNTNISEPKMPSFADLKFVDMSRQMSDSVSIINGEYKFVRQYRYIYMYQTLKKGRLDIPPIAIHVDDKVYKTDGARVEVLDKGQAQRRNQPGQNPRTYGGQQGVDPFQEMEERFNALLNRRAPKPQVLKKPINPDEAFSLRLELDKASAYVGEQITASYYIYVPDTVSLRNIDTLKFPSLSQFWKEDIEIASRLTYEPVIIEGKQFNRALLSSYALFPLKHGNLKVDSYKAKCNVSSRSVFGFGKTYTYTKSSNEERVNVLPLPDANRPENFDGTVGSFKIKAEIEEKTFRKGQPFTLKVKISGRGNAKSIEQPVINFPENLELFDSKSETKFFTNGESFKEFTMYITPTSEGEITIPKIEFHYFNPRKVQYMTASTDPIVINALPGLKENIENSPLALEKSKQKSIAPPAYFASFYSASWLEYEHLPKIIFILFALVLFYFLFILKRDYWTSNYEKVFLKKVSARKSRIKSLAKPEKAKNFAIESLNFIYFLLGENRGEEDTSEKLITNLKSLPMSLRNELEEPLLKLVNTLQAIAFAPEDMTKSLREAKSISQLYTQTIKISDPLIQHHLKSFLID